MHVERRRAIRRLVSEVPAVYMMFDLLWLDGHSTMALPYEQRRARSCSTSGSPARRGRRRRTRSATAHATIEVSKQFGLEGVVAKRLDALRARPSIAAWMKVKNTLRQEFVVGGWLPGEGGRTGSIGSLLVGYYEETASALHYAGKVGQRLAGASIASTSSAARSSIARDTSPFDDRQAAEGRALRRTRARGRGAVHRMDGERHDPPADVPRLRHRQVRAEVVRELPI